MHNNWTNYLNQQSTKRKCILQWDWHWIIFSALLLNSIQNHSLKNYFLCIFVNCPPFLDYIFCYFNPVLAHSISIWTTFYFQFSTYISHFSCEVWTVWLYLGDVTVICSYPGMSDWHEIWVRIVSSRCPIPDVRRNWLVVTLTLLL